jgi:glycosyl hydrolase family 20
MPTKRWLLCITSVLFLGLNLAKAQQRIDSLFPVRAMAIAIPTPNVLDSFITFIHQELAPKKVNTLILRVDYNYQYKSHPELIGNFALSDTAVKKIVDACRKENIRIIPQINLLGHQSWQKQVGKLLQAYPQFDETPEVKMPENYKWPNADSLYCKSYCPLHPDVHKVVFELVDEICGVFEANAFHAGMDEVFYIGNDKCPRCRAIDKAVLFAGEVKKIRDHLNESGKELWIWGDRLIDGKATGVGMWEGSFNNTHPAVEMIPKDVVICDWHYERPDKTAVYFAIKGLRVITCGWRDPGVGVAQVRDMNSFRQGSTAVMRDKFLGIMETVWSPAANFMRAYYSNNSANPIAPENCFRAMFDELVKIEGQR